jgi:hypothetical protein
LENTHATPPPPGGWNIRRRNFWGASIKEKGKTVRKGKVQKLRKIVSKSYKLATVRKINAKSMCGVNIDVLLGYHPQRGQGIWFAARCCKYLQVFLRKCR